MAFRPRLFSIPNERALWRYFEKNARYLENEQIYTIAGILWRYFEKNARYLENEQIYTIAGIYSDDTATLYKKLIDAWKEDYEFHKEEIIAETMSSLGEEHISVQDIIGKKLNPDGFGYE